MNLTILLDLDNTLLANDMDHFLPAYLRKLSSQLSDFPPDQIINNLMLGTRKMISKTMPSGTLEETFDAVFYPALGVEKSQMRSQIEGYYRDVFPSLQYLTSPIPEAQRLILFLARQKYTVVIATNPLFPQAAILHRLNWAGLPVDKSVFSLITTYEYFHFSKPQPAYFAEILAQLGWPNQPAVVIGDNLNEEIIPASRLGLPTYWIGGDHRTLPEGSHQLSAGGPLSGVEEWLRSISTQNIDISYTSPEGILSILKSTPAALDTFTRQLRTSNLQNRMHTGEWSIGEIICHLRDVDREVNLPRLQMVARGENPFLPGIVTDIWAEERNYIAEDPLKALLEFMDIRTQFIELLVSLNEGGWLLPGRHAIFGPTSLKELAAFISTHDRTHIHQAWEVFQHQRS